MAILHRFYCTDGPDLALNCLQRLSADNKVAANKERIKEPSDLGSKRFSQCCLSKYLRPLNLQQTTYSNSVASLAKLRDLIFYVVNSYKISSKEKKDVINLLSAAVVI